MNLSHQAPGSEVLDVAGAKVALRKKFAEEIPGYAPLFASAFQLDVTRASADDVWRTTGRALRAYVAQVVSRDAPFDRWNEGDDSAMDASAVRGLETFRGKGRCVMCHSGPLFTDFAFHNVSTSPPRPDGARKDEGRFLITKQEGDRGRFLTPTLRHVYDTGPYFHDGSKGSLRDVLRHFASSDVTRDPLHDPVFDTPLALDDAEITDLIAFLKALRGAPLNLGIAPVMP